MTEAYAYQNITNLLKDGTDQNFTQFTQENLNSNANITQNSVNEQSLDSSNSTDSNIAKIESTYSIQNKKYDVAVNATKMENTNNMLNFLLKNDKENEPQKTSGHIRNSLKRKKRFAEGKHLLDEGQAHKKLPLIVDYKTNHYPRDREPISLRHPLNYSKLNDFSIQVRHQNNLLNKNKHEHVIPNSVESDERSSDYNQKSKNYQSINGDGEIKNENNFNIKSSSEQIDKNEKINHSTDSNEKKRYYENSNESIENKEQSQEQYNDRRNNTKLEQINEGDENQSTNLNSNEDSLEQYMENNNYTKRKQSNKNKENLRSYADTNEKSRELYKDTGRDLNNKNSSESNENLSSYSGSIEESPEQYSDDVNIKQDYSNESNEGELYKLGVKNRQLNNDSAEKERYRDNSQEIISKEEQSREKHNFSHENRKESEETQLYPKSEETSYQQEYSDTKRSKKAKGNDKFKSKPKSRYGSANSHDNENSSNKELIHHNNFKDNIKKDIKPSEEYTNDPNVNQKSSFIKQYPADFRINNFYGGNSREHVDKNYVIEKIPPQHYVKPAKDLEYPPKPNNITQSLNQLEYQSKPAITIQDVDLGDFSYERIKLNNNGEVESLKDNQEPLESDQSIEGPPPSRPAKYEDKSELAQKNLSNPLVYTRSDNKLIHINDGEIKPVVEINSERDSDESSIEDNSEPILTNISIENINTKEALKTKPRNTSTEKLSGKQNDENVKQQFERIPINYNHVDKENKNEQEETLKPLAVTVQTDIISGTFETTEETPIYNNFDENLNIKFNLEPIKLPEINLPDDILSYAYEQPIYEKNKSKNKEDKKTESFHNEDADSNERYPYHHQKENDNNRYDENYPYTDKHYYGRDEKQNYKTKNHNQDFREEQNEEPDEDVDLYEKFVRERFGKRGSFGERSEKLQNEKDIPYNPQLHKTIQNILKKTETTEKEAQKSGDPKAGYMWTLEYGENL